MKQRLVSRIQQRSQQGYTLLELTLVLAVIAIIATFAIKTYRDSTQANRVNKASLQMQHVLEAALAYHADHGFWPPANPYTGSTESSECEVDASTEGSNPLINYIPNKSNRSNFGGYYCWSGGVDSDLSHQPPEPNDQRFWVALKLPKGYNTLAGRIAAQLPNAVATAEQPKEDVDTDNAVPTNDCDADSGECYIRAEVPKTAQSQSGNEQVKALGNCIPADPATAGDAIPGAVCTGSQCLLPKVASSSSDVYCQQLAAPDLDANTGSTNDEKLRVQYYIHFSCPGQGLTPKLYVTPNFFNMAHFDIASLGDKYQYNPKANVFIEQAMELNTATGDTFDCNDPSLPKDTCRIQIDAEQDVGDYDISTQQLRHISVTHTGTGWTNATGGDNWPEHPGAIGATYTAACVAGG